MEFRILGSLEVEVAGKLVPLGGPREQKVLAVLLLEANRVVSLASIIDALWEDDPPATAAKQARNIVSRLRLLLAAAGEPHILSTDVAGYRLSVPDGSLDARMFTTGVEQAQACAARGQRAQAAHTLRSALSLWRGPALAGLDGRIIAAAATMWDERRYAAMEAYYDHQLALDRHREVLGELSELVACHPLRERPVGQLMTALYRCGRRTDALTLYASTRALLAQETGLDPDSALQELHQQILTADAALTCGQTAQTGGDPASAGQADGSAVSGGGPRATPVPRQLPARARHFVGRGDEQRALLDQVSHVRDAAVVCTIDGTPGIGKTTLAVHTAHEIARHFPDGQLYVNLRGYEPAGTPAPPAEAIRGFLSALGVQPSQMPAGLDALAGLYRTLLADRRVLVVLDNAYDAGQVRPLLPGSPGCLVIVTSRRRLTGLAATDSASLLSLDLFSVSDSRKLLGDRLGRRRLIAEAAAADELIELCARLPLALNIAAARAAARPEHPLAELVAQMRDTRGRLDSLDTGDTATDVRAVFSTSYQHLSDEAGRMFRLLGIHPGPDISLPAAASLAGVPVGQAASHIRELSQLHLLAEPEPGRFAFHDLLRAYAMEQASGDDEEACRAAMDRVLDHYTHTAHAAAAALNPARQRLTLTPPRAGVLPEDIADHEQAVAWLGAERAVLLAATTYQAKTRHDARTWQLPWALADFLHQQGQWHEWEATQRIALTAAELLDDLEGQARARHYLGYACARLADYHGAHAHFDAALRMFGQLDDVANQAHVHLTMAISFEQQERLQDALRHARQSLELYRAAGHRAGQANALNSVGWYQTQLGRHQQALPYCQEAVEVNGALGNREGEAAAWDSLGFVHQQLGDYSRAIACYQEAVNLRPGHTDLYNHAITLIHLGDAHQAAADLAAARDYWQQSLAILTDLEHPDAGQVSARLLALPAPMAGASTAG